MKISVKDQFKKAMPPLLETEKFGREICEYEVIDSTNSRALEIAEKGAKEGTVVVAHRQEKGRGRFDRPWISPEGGLWFSIILKPPVKNVASLTVIFGGAVSKVIEDQTSIPCRFHWPNDIYVNGKKMGGILLESKFRGDVLNYVVAGIGINANMQVEQMSDNFYVCPTTILEETGKTTDLPALLAAILKTLEKDYYYFIENGPEDLIDKYYRRCITIGRKVSITKGDQVGDVSAIATGLTGDGGLAIRLEEGIPAIIYQAERLKLLE